MYIFTFLHGGLHRGPESGLETAYFVQYLDSIRLILHLYIFTFLHGGCSGVQNLGLGRLILSNIWFETANFTFLHFYMGICLGVQNLAWDGIFCPISGLEMSIFTFLHFYIFTWRSSQGSRIWAWDRLFCPKSGLETANFVILAYLTINYAQILYLSAFLLSGPLISLKNQKISNIQYKPVSGPQLTSKIQKYQIYTIISPSRFLDHPAIFQDYYVAQTTSII